MNILVTFAVDAEFDPWRALRPFSAAPLNPKHWSGGIEVHETRIGEHRVWVFLTGIGIRSFDSEAGVCFRDAGVDAVISSGLAGALKTEFVLQQIVTPARIATLRDANGLATARRLTLLAERNGAALLQTMLTADHLVATQEEKRRLSQFADAVDMESFHVVSEFTGAGVPVAVIRAISDRSDEDLPVDFAKCLTPQGRIKAGPLFMQLAGSPGKIPNLVKFGRQSRNAAKCLTAFLDRYIGALNSEIANYQAAAVEAP